MIKYLRITLIIVLCYLKGYSQQGYSQQGPYLRTPVVCDQVLCNTKCRIETQAHNYWRLIKMHRGFDVNDPTIVGSKLIIRDNNFEIIKPDYSEFNGTIKLDTVSQVLTFFNLSNQPENVNVKILENCTLVYTVGEDVTDETKAIWFVWQKYELTD